MTKRIGQVLVLSVSLASSALAAELPSAAQIDPIAQELDAVGKDTTRYDPSVVMRGIFGRIEQAKSRFSSMDYQGALFLLLPILDSQVILDRNTTIECVYMTAESLFHVGDDNAANQYFSQLLSMQRGSDEISTLIRLMELSDRLDRYDLFRKYLLRYAELSSSILPQVRYWYGKFLFLRKDDEQARSELVQVPFGDAYGLRSQYIIASILIRQKQYDEAHRYLDRIINTEIKAIADRNVKDLAILARARLFYDQDQLRDAVLTYKKLPLDSVYVPSMLYELAMSYMRYGDFVRSDRLSTEEENVKALRAREVYKGALRTVQMLLRWRKSSGHDPKVKLVFADLMMRLGKDERALKTYRLLSTQFGVIKPTLSLVQKQPEDLLNAIFGDAGQNVIPAEAFSWLASQPEMVASEDAWRDVKRGRQDVRELRAQYEAFLLTLQAELEKSDAQLARNLNQIFSLQSRLLELKKSEVDFYMNQVTGGLGSGGLLDIRLKNQLQVPYIAQSMKCTLDGKTICSVTFDGSKGQFNELVSIASLKLTPGKHQLVVTMDYRINVEEIFGALHYTITTNHEVIGQLNQIQTVDLTLMNDESPSQKPRLALAKNGVRSVAPGLTMDQWLRIEQLMRAREELEGKWQKRDMNAIRARREVHDLYLRYFEVLKNQESILLVAANRQDAVSPLDGLSDQSAALVWRLVNYLDTEFEKMSLVARQQIQKLDVLDSKYVDAQKAFFPAAGAAIQRSVPSWLSRVDWMLISADNGIMRGVLKEKYRQSERIQQIEQVKAAELNRLEQEFNGDEGGAP